MVIAAPLLVERLALRTARTPVVHTGMGPHRSERSRRGLGDGPLLVAGVGGGLAKPVRPGHVVVASEIRSPEGATVTCHGTTRLVTDLRRLGLVVHCGPICSAPRLARREELATLAATGALAVDMESWWLAPPPGTPFAVVRAISDGIEAPLVSPSIVSRGLAALQALRRGVPALDAWASAS